MEIFVGQITYKCCLPLAKFPHDVVIAGLGDDEVLGLIKGGGCCNIVLWFGINLQYNNKYKFSFKIHIKF